MIKNFDLYIENIKLALGQNNHFDKLKNKSVLITGANGMIASCIIDIINYLNKNLGYNIHIVALMREQDRILDRFEKYDNFEALVQDVNNPITYANHIDYVIHAASNADPKSFSMDPVGTMTANFTGMKNILDFAKDGDVTRVLYISSGEIYGQGDSSTEAFTEDYVGKTEIVNPRSCYPIGKMASETLCAAYVSQYELDVVIARPSHSYGPTQSDRDSRASSQFIRNGVDGIDIIMKSKGEQVRSYCYVVDCAIGILTILCNGENCKAYNVANKSSIVSIKELAETIADKANVKLLFELPTESEKKSYNPVTRSVLEGSKLESIGWKPVFDIYNGLKNTLNIMKGI